MTQTPHADALLTDLISGTPQIEAFATLKEEHEREKALHVLIALLSDSDPRLQERAAKALGALGDRRAVEPLLKLLESIEDNFEYDLVDAVVNGLIHIGDPETIVPLMTYADVRRSQVLRRNFNRFNREDLLRVLGQAIISPDGIRNCAFDILVEIDDPGAIPLLIMELDEFIGGSCVFAVKRWGTGAMPFIIPCLTDADAIVRRQAAKALGILGDPHMVSVLLPLLNDEHPDVRTHAAIALGRLGDPSGLHLIYTTLDSSSYTDLEEVLTALKVLHAPCVPMLIKLVTRLPQDQLYDRFELVVLFAEIFAEQGDPAVLPTLEILFSFLYDDDGATRSIVQQAIDAIKARMDGLQ